MYTFDEEMRILLAEHNIKEARWEIADLLKRLEGGRRRAIDDTEIATLKALYKGWVQTADELASPRVVHEYSRLFRVMDRAWRI